jgi:hypothetical protein
VKDLIFRQQQVGSLRHGFHGDEVRRRPFIDQAPTSREGGAGVAAAAAGWAWFTELLIGRMRPAPNCSMDTVPGFGLQVRAGGLLFHSQSGITSLAQPGLLHSDATMIR